MKLSIEEITYSRGRTNHYTIYDVKGDIHLIFGSYYRKVVGGPLYESTMYFIKDNSKWNLARKRIIQNRDKETIEERDNWIYLSSELKDFVIDVEELYLDGIRKKLNSVEKMN
ncbi:hypothetical protein KQ939_17005 [Planococcus sp. CP5-4]|uniref:hypothetical protein n=1 Tax=Planococcus TaxID=1372 RepID=UPI00084C15F8|nr:MULTISPECIES: hypothetical protein [Planococcus]MBU9674799.1 hypothetical protein [Planococcus sp. CP5-4_YE]MBV0910568.1 hypothetical protein [Planococcus sp. CP5-4_UN]MBW6065375.1 hypothetical protein [Planococcus sp. CP5-4]OED32519.1 hypothetical protein BHE17_08720 [Planococcus maritimus]